jgi:hypothetical protein
VFGAEIEHDSEYVGGEEDMTSDAAGLFAHGHILIQK